MATDRSDSSSVRVEFDDSADGVDDAGTIPDASGTVPGSGGSTGRLFAIAAALGTVVLMVVLLRPESGTSAVGEPVGVPEAPAVTTTTGGRFQPDSTSGPSSTATTTNPTVDFERVELDGGFLGDVVKIDGGWIATLEKGSQPEVVRSNSGLDWVPLSESELPGRVLGYGVVRSEILIATSTPSEASGASEIQIWRLDEKDEWQPADEFTPYSADSEARHAFFSNWGVAILLELPSDDEIVPSMYMGELLEGILPPDVAAQTCSVERIWVDVDEASRVVYAFEFRNCAGDAIATVPADELPPDDLPNLVNCVEHLANSNEPGEGLVVLAPRSAPEIHNLGFDESLIGVIPTRDGVLTASLSRFDMSGCSEAGVERGRMRPPTVRRWQSDVGGAGVEVEADWPFEALSSIFFLIERPDDSLTFLTPSSAYRTTTAFETFELLAENPLSDGFLRPIFGGENFISQSFQRIAVSDDSGSWSEVDIGAFPSAEFVLATDEYVVVRVESSGSARSVELVKIPFAPG